MQSLHDVWVNWFEGEENGYNICPFYEWRKEDRLELLDSVPVIKVSKKRFWFIENDMCELPKQLLERIKEKAFMRKNHERIQLEYCVVLTDGVGILAVDTIGYNIPVRKSRLIPRQEQMVYELVEKMGCMEFHEDAQLHCQKEHHCLSPSPMTMYGLTRKERQLKLLMYMALEKIKLENNVAQLRYWFTEWSPIRYNEARNQDFEQLWSMFETELCDGWTSRHITFTEKLVKRESYLEKLWEIEQDQKVN
ncbi:MAG: DUF3603 family protein [Bacilli bacterium]